MTSWHLKRGRLLSEVNLEHALQGNTLRVYWYILTVRKPVSAREVQRSLRLSSPSVALYHLEKLRVLKLVKKDNMGQYSLVEKVKVGLLRFFVGLGRHLIPRYFLYTTYFVGLLVFYWIVFRMTFDIRDAYIMILGISGIIISLYELIAIWRMERL